MHGTLKQDAQNTINIRSCGTISYSRYLHLSANVVSKVGVFSPGERRIGAGLSRNEQDTQIGPHVFCGTKLNLPHTLPYTRRGISATIGVKATPLHHRFISRTLTDYVLLRRG